MEKNQLTGDKAKQQVWFKRKLYGWGWTPSTWQGWLVILLYVLIVTGVPLVAGLLLDLEQGGEWVLVLVSIGMPIVFTPALIWISYKKGEKPTWQWGERVEDEGE